MHENSCEGANGRKPWTDIARPEGAGADRHPGGVWAEAEAPASHVSTAGAVSRPEARVLNAV